MTNMSRKRPKLFNIEESQEDGSEVFFVSAAAAAAARPPSNLGFSLPSPATPASSSQFVSLDTVTSDQRRIIREILPIPSRPIPGLSNPSMASSPPELTTHYPSINDIPNWDQFFVGDDEIITVDVDTEVEEHARRYLNSVSAHYAMPGVPELRRTSGGSSSTCLGRAYDHLDS